MLYYHKIKKDEVITLKDNFLYYLSTVEEDPIIKHCLPKCVTSYYLIIITSDKDDTLVQKITVWTRHPKDYNYKDKDLIEGFPKIVTTFNKYNSLVYNIKSDIMEQIKINYKERKILTPDAEKEVSFIVEETNLNLQQDVIATKRVLKVKERQLEDIKSTYPLDVQKYLALQCEIENLTNSLAKVAILQAELGLKVTALE